MASLLLVLVVARVLVPIPLALTIIPAMMALVTIFGFVAASVAVHDDDLMDVLANDRVDLFRDMLVD